MLVSIFLFATVCATTDQLERVRRDSIGQNRLRNNLSLFLDRHNQVIPDQSDTLSMEKQLAQRLIQSYNKGETGVKQVQSFLQMMHTARKPNGNRRVRNGRLGSLMSRLRNRSS